MTKYSAFGAVLNAGIQQVETTTLVLGSGSIGTSGNATVIVTATGMTGSPITTNVAVLSGDNVDTICTKIRTALDGVGNITAMWRIGGSGNIITLTKKIATANIANGNLSVADGTCVGITSNTTSTETIAGIAPVAIAQIKGMNAPALSVDTEDVTTHDQATAFEELVTTILRSGEVSLDLVYDPNGNTHKNASGGLLYWLNNKTRVYFDFVFSGTYNWTFEGYVTGFEADDPHDGALTASVTIKIDGALLLE